MSAEHGPRAIERHCDVAIVGGSEAGLAAALELARAGRSVLVVDPGEPHDGAAVDPGGGPSREEVRRHGGEVLAGRATAVTPLDDGRVRVGLVGGHSIVARRVVIGGSGDGELPEGVVQLVAADGEAPSVADAGRVAARIEAELTEDDRRNPGRTSAQQADWDRRYGDDPIWSGNPNGTLVHEVAGLTPGRALDVGAGEGGDAIWLAEQGWTVTAADISQRALQRVDAEATRRGLRVTCLHVDANDDGAFPASAFDLVSLQYASIPRTPDDRAVRNVLRAVAPGGTLLVVSHDLDPMRTPIDTTTHSRAFDPDAYVRVDDFVAALVGRAEWRVEVVEKRSRPPGAVSTHHVDDVVLRARRSV